MSFNMSNTSQICIPPLAIVVLKNTDQNGAYMFPIQLKKEKASNICE
jgi:hypothetical protein